MSACGWCQASFGSDRPGARFCSRKCRQSAFRLRRRSGTSFGAAGTPAGLRFAYADPPYPGLARKYYRERPEFAGEVDHRELIESLAAAGYAGWALSTSSKALGDVLPMCPGARVGAWVKPIGVPAATYGPHSTWEPLIVVGGRKRRPGVRDWLRAQPARNGGELPGRKPIAFCAWLFDMLGMLPGDSLEDLFPGTGVVARAWSLLSAEYSATLSSAAGAGRQLSFLSLAPRGTESPGAARRPPGAIDAESLDLAQVLDDAASLDVVADAGGGAP